MTTICKKCGGPVFWMKVQGKQNCYNLDGKIHWDTCSARRWHQTKETGERFQDKRGSGYANSIHGTKFDSLPGTFITGEHYKVFDGCKNCVPPWEPCKGCPAREYLKQVKREFAHAPANASRLSAGDVAQWQ